MIDDECKHCGTELTCMGGASAHPSDWYCPNGECPGKVPAQRTYAVSWFIDIDAESPLEAAKQALKYQRDPASTATVFNVAYTFEGKKLEVEIDLGVYTPPEDDKVCVLQLIGCREVDGCVTWVPDSQAQYWSVYKGKPGEFVVLADFYDKKTADAFTYVTAKMYGYTIDDKTVELNRPSLGRGTRE